MEGRPQSRIILVIGAPGSGKGTLSKNLVQRQPDVFVHISTGDICRDHVARNTNLGQVFQQYMGRGDFVPDHLMIQMIQSRLTEGDIIGKTVLLDGFPRTPNQARELSRFVDIDRVLLLQSPDDVCIQRVLQRRIDPFTGISYNLEHALPPTDEIRDRLVQRNTDVDQSIIVIRLGTYHHSLAPILGYFSGRMFAVNTNQSISNADIAFRHNIDRPLPPVLSAAAAKKVVTEVKKVEKKRLCIVCMSNSSDHLIMPCGHKCACEDCLLQCEKCPICRSHISGFIKVFESGVSDSESESVGEEEEEENEPEEPGEHIEGWNDEIRPYVPPVPVSVSGISIAPCDPLMIGGAHRIGITINIPDIDVKPDIDVCCVIDISGSMGEEAQFQDPNDEKRTISEGMNQLDIVKHSVKTIIHLLGPRDRLSIVAFDSLAETAFVLKEMDEHGKKDAILALELLQPRNSTNIWAGLQGGLDSLRLAGGLANNRKRFLFFLTDGQPSDSPPAGEHMALRGYFESHPDFKCMVSTFGFSYNLKSKLLLNIAKEGNGTFAFIPDAKIVGTCFVNAVANAKTCVGLDARLHVTPKNGACFWNHPIIDHELPCNQVPWGIVVKLGPLHMGQPRDIVVLMDQIPIPAQDYVDVTLEYGQEDGGDAIKINCIGPIVGLPPTNDSIIAFLRSEACSKIASVIDLCESKGAEGNQMMNMLIGRVTAVSIASPDPRISKLLEDLVGRASKAISTPERFNRWGSHYLRALCRSHQYQMRTNFMDPGLQLYGGVEFNKLVESGGEIFKTLPMKKYTDYQRAQNGGGGNQQQQRRAAAPPPVQSNTVYYGGNGGGCFGPESTVITAKGMKRVSDVEAGDMLQVSTGEYLPVVCTVELIGKRNDMILMNSGLCITPTHPIRIGSSRPFLTATTYRELIIATQQEVDSVYNFVLEGSKDRHLLVDGFQCVTYGHQSTDPSIYHAFYSTNQVLNHLKKQNGYESGRVVIQGKIRH